MVAREDFINEHPDVIKTFLQGWMDGTTEANRNPDKVVRLLMDNEPLYNELGEQGTRASLATVKWADLSDNTLLFGLDGSDPLFDRIFKYASQAWVKRGYITSAVSPERVKDTSLLKEIYAAAPVQPATDPKVGPAGNDIEKRQAIMSKPLYIHFPYGSSTLDPDAQQVLDQVATLAQTYSGTYIRIEGNTDNIGASSLNRDLSLMRAQAVANFLVQHYHLDRNRFIVVGNGSDKPLMSNMTPEGQAANRRIDIEIVPVK
jgi:NitT/TauT family transport system substrate-binding protein